MLNEGRSQVEEH